MGSLVDATVAAGVEDQFTRNIKANGRADGVGGGKIEILLGVVPFRRSGLDFIAQAESEGELAGRFPSVLHIPAEEVLVGGWELVETRLVRAASDSEQKRSETVAGIWRCLLWIRPRRGGSLELKCGVGKVSAIDTAPNIHKAKSYTVPSPDFREVDGIGPDGLRHDVVVQVNWRPKVGITLWLNLRE